MGAVFDVVAAEVPPCQGVFAPAPGCGKPALMAALRAMVCSRCPADFWDQALAAKEILCQGPDWLTASSKLMSEESAVGRQHLKSPPPSRIQQGPACSNFRTSLPSKSAISGVISPWAMMGWSYRTWSFQENRSWPRVCQ